MSGLVLIFVLAGVCYLGWFFGRLHEAEVDYRQEKLDMAAFDWASRNNRLPTVTYLVDSETGEVLQQHTS